MAAKNKTNDRYFREFCSDKVEWGSLAVPGQKFEYKADASFKAVAYDGVTLSANLWKAKEEARILLAVGVHAPYVAVENNLAI